LLKKSKTVKKNGLELLPFSAFFASSAVKKDLKTVRSEKPLTAECAEGAEVRQNTEGKNVAFC
jgi:hypothetical protein